MKSNDPEIIMRFANETGLEIFQILVKRSETLGVQTFENIFGALTAATQFAWRTSPASCRSST